MPYSPIHFTNVTFLARDIVMKPSRNMLGKVIILLLIRKLLAFRKYGLSHKSTAQNSYPSKTIINASCFCNDKVILSFERRMLFNI